MATQTVPSQDCSPQLGLSPWAVARLVGGSASLTKYLSSLPEPGSLVHIWWQAPWFCCLASQAYSTPSSKKFHRASVRVCWLECSSILVGGVLADASMHGAHSQLSSQLLQGLRQIKVDLEASPLGLPLIELVYLRVAQINGCSYCLNMHTK